MAGFREFVTGEVLTALNVDDFLMKQTVMKFADAGARDTALGTAVGGANALREGMVAYLDSTDEVLAYNGTAWSALGAAGIGSNVVQTVKTDTFATSSTSFVDLTGLSASITPTTATSKILVIADISGTTSGTAIDFLNLVRGTTDIYQGTSVGSRTAASKAFRVEGLFSWYGQLVFMDAPATTSLTTYKIQIKASAGTVTVGATGDDSNVSANGRFATSLTVIEVAA